MRGTRNICKAPCETLDSPYKSTAAFKPYSYPMSFHRIFSVDICQYFNVLFQKISLESVFHYQYDFDESRLALLPAPLKVDATFRKKSKNPLNHFENPLVNLTVPSHFLHSTIRIIMFLSNHHILKASIIYNIDPVLHGKYGYGL